MSMLRAVVLSALLGLAGQWACAVSTTGALAEAAQDFTYAGKPIHPKLVSRFLTWESDKGYPMTVSVDVAAAFDNNEYDNGGVRKGENGAIVCSNANDKSVDSYRWFGRMEDGSHVVHVWHDDAEGSRNMGLFFFRFSTGEGFLPNGKQYERLLMNAVRWYMPFDARSSVKVAGNSVTLSDMDGSGPVVIKAAAAITHAAAQESLNIKNALNEIDKGFLCGGKPIHPGLVLNFIGSLAPKGIPITASVDVAAAFNSNQYFADDVQKAENGSYRITEGNGQGFFAYRWCGRMGDGTHVVRTFLNKGGSGVFSHLCFVRFARATSWEPDGKAYAQLLMTVLRVCPLPADSNDAPESVTANQVTVGKSVIPPMERR